MEKRRKRNRLLDRLNDMKLAHKLRIVQIFCVLLPLLITNIVIVTIMINSEKKSDLQETRSVAYSIRYTLESEVASAVNLMQSIYRDAYVNDFMMWTYESGLEYFIAQYNFRQRSLFAINSVSAQCLVSIYADNTTLINGGNLYRIDRAENENWFKQVMKGTEEIMLFSDFEKVDQNMKRTIYLARRMNLFSQDNRRSAIRIDINYSDLLHSIINAKYFTTCYVCEGDRILFSNDGRGGPMADYERISQEQIDNALVHDVMEYYGNKWDIYIMPSSKRYFSVIQNNFATISFLIILNLLFPYLLIRLINKSIVSRLKEMEETFGNTKSGELFELPEVSGRDEIGQLMKSYNHMAGRINELINKEYKDRLKHQEMDIARQKAELLALHSQINPHFLFNALESIRMQSVVKKEFETADMLEKLALMERQNVDWHNDNVMVKEEIRFIEAYLELQTYRFKNKLRYQITVDEDCYDYRIPKLTLVTFVENACIHGMESKTSFTWVFVRVSHDDTNMIMEIEDTGIGISDDRKQILLDEMKTINIQTLQKKTKIGILNASLRLRMFSEEQVKFEIESEPNAGTLIIITVPLSKVKK